MIGDDEGDRPAVARAARSDTPNDELEPGTEASKHGADLQAYIGRQLRAVFDDVAKQPVPDRFLDLMKRLESVGR